MNVTGDQSELQGEQAAATGHDAAVDERLVALAQRDPAAFAALYERYADAVFGYALRRLRDRDRAADVTARIFTRALAALPSYRRRHSASFRSWLFTIAHNTIVDEGQRRRDHLPLEPLDAAGRLREPSRGPEDRAIAADEGARLHAALARLPASQRQVIELRLAGLTGPEIAEATGTSAYRLARETKLAADERQRIEEEIMTTVTHPAARLTLGKVPAQPGQDGHPAPPSSVPARLVNARIGPRGRFTSIASGALVAALLLAIVAGYGVRNGWGPWQHDDQPTRIAAAPALAPNTLALPNPQDCDVQPLTNPELQKILTAPYEQRTTAISKKPVPVDVVDGAAILQVYQQIRDCALVGNGGDAVFALMSPHAVQEMYWRGSSMSGIFDTRTSQPGTAATPASSASAFVWQPDFSKTDTYFAEIHTDSMEQTTDGRVIAWIGWYNQQAQPPKTGSPLDGLVFIKIDGQWKLDDWVFGTQILTDAGR